MPIGKVLIYRLLFCVSVCVCTVTDFSADDKASGVKFCTVVRRCPGQRISNFGNFAPPETQNRTNRRAAASIADRCQSPPLTVHALAPRHVCIYGRARRWTYLFDLRHKLLTQLLFLVSLENY